MVNKINFNFVGISTSSKEVKESYIKEYYLLVHKHN